MFYSLNAYRGANNGYYAGGHYLSLQGHEICIFVLINHCISPVKYIKEESVHTFFFLLLFWHVDIVMDGMLYSTTW